jgi:hypothetical protein
MNNPMILESLGNRIDLQIERVEKLTLDLSALDKRRRALWIAQDLDGLDVANDLDVVEARIAETGDLLDRAELGLDELHRRRAAAMTEIELVRHRQNCADLATLNEQTDRLAKQYVKAAAAFFRSLSALQSHTYKQRRLAIEINRVAYDSDLPAVDAYIAPLRLQVDARPSLDLWPQLPDNLMVSIEISDRLGAHASPDARTVEILQRTADWHERKSK